MSSIHGKNSLSFRKTRTDSNGSSSATITQDVKFAHESVAGGETTIDLDALVTPTSIDTGIINPTGGQLAALNLLSNSNSILMISSHKGTLQQGSWQISNSGRQINLSFSTAANEVFTVQVRTTQATANVVDADAFTCTGTLTAGNTDIPLGQVFKLNANDLTQIGEVILYIDGVQQFRNVGNVTAAPLAEGNYEEVDAGNNQTNLLRMNQTFPTDVSWAVVSNGLIVNAEPNNSHTQAIESLGGQLDALIPTVASLAGVPDTDFQSTPNSVDLKAFADKLYTACDDIESNDTDIAALQTGKKDEFEIKWQRKDLVGAVSAASTVSSLTFNNLEIGKTYRVGGKLFPQGSGAINFQISFDDGITTGLYQWMTVKDVSGAEEDNQPVYFIFTATTTTMRTYCVSYSNGSMSGQSHLILEELPNHTETTDWT